ncbi:MAG: ABC transporter permease [Clostridia bacterium]|nr:ABC transporter permease [Clostridia bacterium]
MENKRKFNLNLFHINVDKIEGFNDLSASDFEAATKSEKDNMVTMHKSISYWADARRRFRKNTVSMVSLFVFLAILIFAFVGPLVIPYSYDMQQRSSGDLKPMQYSETEQAAKSLLERGDALYQMSLQNGSSNHLGTVSGISYYYFKYKNKTYSFAVERIIEKSAILLDVDGEHKITCVKEADIRAFIDGDTSKALYFDCTEGEIPEGAVELPTTTRVFPHVFGTNAQGEDLMAQCMYGARVSIIIGIFAALIVLVIGAIYGSISGFAGGAVDFVMMRVVDLIYSVPDVLIVLLLQVVLKDPLQKWFDSSNLGFVKALGELGVGIVSIFITFALLYWVGMARLIRGQVLMLKKQEYVTAATALGAPTGRIIRRHLLPNCVGQLMISVCLQIPSAIFLESFLSFLGLGVSAPMPSLGSLCSDALGSLRLYPHRLLIPGIILSLLVLSLNLVGDGLRDALDPRLKK